MSKKASENDSTLDSETFEEIAVVGSFELDHSLGFMARRLNSLASALFAETSGQAEVTAMQMGVLITIAKAGCIALPELSRRMKVDRSTLQEVATRLFIRGIIARRISPQDRRVHQLWLTEKGNAIIERHLDDARKMEERLIAGLPPRQAAAVLKGISAILAHHCC